MIKVLLAFMTVSMFVSAGWAATFYVDQATGDDFNDGLSESAAFESISCAAAVAAAGDTVLIKSGEYAESVVPANSGEEGTPIVFAAFPGHTPLILGSERIEDWTNYDGNVYYATIPWDVVSDTYPQPHQDRIPMTSASGASVSPYSSMQASLNDVAGPGDWFFDRNGRKLYLHVYDTGQGYDPGDYLIEVAKRRHCFNLGRRSHIEVKGLNMGFTYGSDTEEGVVMLYNSHHISIENNTICNSGGCGIEMKDWAGANSNIAIENNTIHTNWDYGILLINDCEDVLLTVENNTLYGNTRQGISLNYGNFIAVTGNIVFENDHFSQVGSDHAGMFLSSCQDVEISFNECYGNPAEGTDYFSGGIYVMLGAGALIHHNICHGNTTGILVQDHDYAEIYNNTLYRNSVLGFFAQRSEWGTFENNIVVAPPGGSSQGEGLVVIEEKTGWTLDFNLYYQTHESNMMVWDDYCYPPSKYEDYKAASGNDADSLAPYVEPGLSDPDNGDFSLLPTSPCIDAGVDVGLAEDFAGTLLPQGNGFDIGAYEALPAPSATTDAATWVGETTATLNGTVDPNGLATTAWFEWGTGASYGNRLPVSQADSYDVGSSGASSVAGRLAGLAESAEYHYRVVAQNSEGTASYGADRTFSTGAVGSSCAFHSPLMVDGGPEYESFADALEYVPFGGAILIGPTAVAEDVDIDVPDISFRLEGGWNCDFGSRTGTSSTIRGSFTIKEGSVEVDGLTVD